MWIISNRLKPSKIEYIVKGYFNNLQGEAMIYLNLSHSGFFKYAVLLIMCSSESVFAVWTKKLCNSKILSLWKSK